MEVKVFKISKQIQLCDVEVTTGWHGDNPTTVIGRVTLHTNDIEKMKKALIELEESKK